MADFPQLHTEDTDGNEAKINLSVGSQDVGAQPGASFASSDTSFRAHKPPPAPQTEGKMQYFSSLLQQADHFLSASREDLRQLSPTASPSNSTAASPARVGSPYRPAHVSSILRDRSVTSTSDAADGSNSIHREKKSVSFPMDSPPESQAQLQQTRPGFHAQELASDDLGRWTPSADSNSSESTLGSAWAHMDPFSFAAVIQQNVLGPPSSPSTVAQDESMSNGVNDPLGDADDFRLIGGDDTVPRRTVSAPSTFTSANTLSSSPRSTSVRSRTAGHPVVIETTLSGRRREDDPGSNTSSAQTSPRRILHLSGVSASSDSYLDLDDISLASQHSEQPPEVVSQLNPLLEGSGEFLRTALSRISGRHLQPHVVGAYLERAQQLDVARSVVLADARSSAHSGGTADEFIQNDAHACIWTETLVGAAGLKTVPVDVTLSMAAPNDSSLDPQLFVLRIKAASHPYSGQLRTGDIIVRINDEVIARDTMKPKNGDHISCLVDHLADINRTRVLAAVISNKLPQHGLSLRPQSPMPRNDSIGLEKAPVIVVEGDQEHVNESPTPNAEDKPEDTTFTGTHETTSVLGSEEPPSSNGRVDTTANDAEPNDNAKTGPTHPSDSVLPDKLDAMTLSSNQRGSKSPASPCKALSRASFTPFPQTREQLQLPLHDIMLVKFAHALKEGEGDPLAWSYYLSKKCLSNGRKAAADDSQHDKLQAQLRKMDGGISTVATALERQLSVGKPLHSFHSIDGHKVLVLYRFVGDDDAVLVVAGAMSVFRDTRRLHDLADACSDTLRLLDWKNCTNFVADAALQARAVMAFDALMQFVVDPLRQPPLSRALCKPTSWTLRGRLHAQVSNLLTSIWDGTFMSEQANGIMVPIGHLLLLRGKLLCSSLPPRLEALAFMVCRLHGTTSGESPAQSQGVSERRPMLQVLLPFKTMSEQDLHILITASDSTVLALVMQCLGPTKLICDGPATRGRQIVLELLASGLHDKLVDAMQQNDTTSSPVITPSSSVFSIDQAGNSPSPSPRLPRSTSATSPSSPLMFSETAGRGRTATSAGLPLQSRSSPGSQSPITRSSSLGTESVSPSAPPFAAGRSASASNADHLMAAVSRIRRERRAQAGASNLANLQESWESLMGSDMDVAMYDDRERRRLSIAGLRKKKRVVQKLLAMPKLKAQDPRTIAASGRGNALYHFVSLDDASGVLVTDSTHLKISGKGDETNATSVAALVHSAFLSAVQRLREVLRKRWSMTKSPHSSHEASSTSLGVGAASQLRTARRRFDQPIEAGMLFNLSATSDVFASADSATMTSGATTPTADRGGHGSLSVSITQEDDAIDEQRTSSIRSAASASTADAVGSTGRDDDDFLDPAQQAVIQRRAGKRSRRHAQAASSDSLSFWVCGRLTWQNDSDSCRECYVCYRDGTAQQVVEMAFRIQLGE